MDDVWGLFLGMPHGATPAAVTTNKNIIMSCFKSSRTFKIKRVGQTAVSDNQSSSVTLNELAKKVKDFFSIGQGQLTPQSMVGPNSDVNQGS